MMRGALQLALTVALALELVLTLAMVLALALALTLTLALEFALTLALAIQLALALNKKTEENLRYQITPCHTIKNRKRVGSARVST